MRINRRRLLRSVGLGGALALLPRWDAGAAAVLDPVAEAAAAGVD